jgi:hypothetical protein
VASRAGPAPPIRIRTAWWALRSLQTAHLGIVNSPAAWSAALDFLRSLREDGDERDESD